jgi:8-oxo-dGTP diphosphatase
MMLTVDVALIINKKRILLIKRAKDPFLSALVLPGGHAEDFDPSLKHAAARELFEESGILVRPEELTFLAILDLPGRDSRPDRRISVVYRADLPDESRLSSARADSDALSLHLKNIASLKKSDFGFDHFSVIEMI